MKVKMKVEMSGTRNGEEWPAPGGEVNLPKAEAVKLCDAGLAVPVAEWDEDVETREQPADVGPESPDENKKDADRSAKQAEKRAKDQPQPASRRQARATAKANS